MPKQLDNVQLAHLEGFVKQCQDMNIDPEQLLKIIADEKEKISPKTQAKTVAGGALRGGLAGAAAGGTAGVTIPLVLAAVHMLKHPELAGSVRLKDVARLIGAGGIMGATGGGMLGAGYGGVNAAVDSGLPSDTRTGATMKGMRRGATAGAALGTIGGIAKPVAELLALKMMGGNIGDVGGKNIAKAFGRSALSGATTGLVGGGALGSILGASTGKVASYDAVQRIWDKMGVAETTPNPQPANPGAIHVAQKKPGSGLNVAGLTGQTPYAGSGVSTGASAIISRGAARDALGGGLGVSGGGMSRTASADKPPIAVEATKDISQASGKDSEEPPNVRLDEQPEISPTERLVRIRARLKR